MYVANCIVLSVGYDHDHEPQVFIGSVPIATPPQNKKLVQICFVNQMNKGCGDYRSSDLEMFSQYYGVQSPMLTR